VTLGGQWLRCLEAAHAMCHCYGLSKHRSTLSRTPPRSCAGSPPSTTSATRQPNFTQPQAVVGKRRLTLSSRMLRRAPKAARRGASTVTRRLQPRPMMAVASTSNQIAPAWCAPWLLQAVASIRRGRPRTTSRSSLRRFARTTPTVSSTSSGTIS
jgi:hypothetical protein